MDSGWMSRAHWYESVDNREESTDNGLMSMDSGLMSRAKGSCRWTNGCCPRTNGWCPWPAGLFEQTVSRCGRTNRRCGRTARYRKRISINELGDSTSETCPSRDRPFDDSAPVPTSTLHRLFHRSNSNQLHAVYLMRHRTAGRQPVAVWRRAKTREVSSDGSTSSTHGRSGSAACPALSRADPPAGADAHAPSASGSPTSHNQGPAKRPDWRRARGSDDRHDFAMHTAGMCARRAGHDNEGIGDGTDREDAGRSGGRHDQPSRLCRADPESRRQYPASRLPYRPNRRLNPGCADRTLRGCSRYARVAGRTFKPTCLSCWPR